MKRILITALLLLGAAEARAQRWELAGEVRGGVVAVAGTNNVLGGDPSSECGPNVTSDVGAAVSGLGVALLTTASSRYQLSLGAGYYKYRCTPSLTRPVAGLDFRGDHRLDGRTLLSTSARALVDQFDRSLLVESGGTPNLSVPYVTAGAGVDLDRIISGRMGLHGSLALETLQLLSAEHNISPYLTLGPMEVATLGLTGFKDTVRERFEIPIAYRVAHFYPATLQNDPNDSRWQLPWSQDVAVSFAWERRPSPLWSFRLAAGLAAAYQPNLCVERGQTEPANNSCSIDQAHPNIRSASDAPPLEVGLGQRATGTVIAEASLLYHDRATLYELQFQRDYEPSAYAGALVLANRVNANAAWRVTRDLSFTASIHLTQLGGSSPAPVQDSMGNLVAPQPLVSPQDRVFLAAQGTAGVDWYFLGPLGLYAQADLGAFGIKGAQVNSTFGDGFSVSALSGPNEPSTTVLRVSGAVGLRIALRPSAREIELLRTARMLP